MHLRLVSEVDQVVTSAAMTGYCIPFPVAGYTLQMQTHMAATLNLDWLACLVQDAARLGDANASIKIADILRNLDRAVMEVRPGAVLFHPFISSSGERGPFIDPYARAGILGIDQNVRLPQVARAVYDGLGLAARDCYIAMGGLPSSVRVTGGAAQSKSIRAILAACLNCPVLAATHDEAGAAGAAMMAAVSVGLYEDMAACAARWAAGDEGGTEHPDPTLAGIYDDLFPIYRAGYEAYRPCGVSCMPLAERVMVSETHAREAAVIGDNFMLPEKFEHAIREACGEALAIRTVCLPFPDEGMESGIAGLKEYQGAPDEIVKFVGKAELLVTHLAPVSGEMLDEMPELKMITVARGGPVNIDVAAERERGIVVCNAPGRNASAVAEFTVGAILVETRLIRLGHEAMRKGIWRGDLYRADSNRSRTLRNDSGLNRLRSSWQARRAAAETLRLQNCDQQSLQPAF